MCKNLNSISAQNGKTFVGQLLALTPVAFRVNMARISEERATEPAATGTTEPVTESLATATEPATGQPATITMPTIEMESSASDPVGEFIEVDMLEDEAIDAIIGTILMDDDDDIPTVPPNSPFPQDLADFLMDHGSNEVNMDFLLELEGQLSQVLNNEGVQ